MIQVKFPFAATLILLAACQPDRESASPSTSPAPAPAAAGKTVPPAPVEPAAEAQPTLASEAAPSEETPAARYAKVKQEYQDAMSVYFTTVFKNAKTEADYEAIRKTTSIPDGQPYLVRARAIVDEDPASPLALEVITWMLTEVSGNRDQTALLAIVEEHHMQSEKLGTLASAMANDPEGQGQAFAWKVVEASPNARVRGTALYALAGAKRRDIDDAMRVQAANTADELDLVADRYGDRLGSLKALDVPAEQKNAEAMLERTVKEYADVPMGKTTLGERAGSDLFEMRNLAVGKVAPDIEGEDLDGKRFALADYRGKIVLLDFWGYW
jgi:hypothetical protein